MVRRFKYSLRFKLTILLMVLMTLTIFGSLGITWIGARTYFLQHLKNRMEEMYYDINDIFSNEEYTENDVREALSNLEAKNEINVFVLTRNGIIYSTTDEKSTMRESMQAISDLLNGEDEDGLEDAFDADQSGYFFFNKNNDVKMNSSFYDLVGVLDDGSMVVLRSSAKRFDESVVNTIKLSSYVGIITIFVACLVIFFASAHYTRPIHEMAVVAKRMAQLDFDSKVDCTSQDEIGELGRSINSLSEELETTISELKQANAELRKDIEEKTQIDEMRKEFLSHVSHELKTPIALIQGYAEGLKENISDDMESKDFYCEVIMDEANRMNKMVKKLLSLNELEFGTNRVHFERFDIVELIQNINNTTDILLQQNQNRLQFDYYQPIYVWGDEFMIEDVYSNYLTNAIHYAPAGGKVIITLEEKENSLLRINVYNDGNPIPEEELDKIWIKFYKVDKARTREYGGNGIGLSIVAATMKQHGRDYGAYNTENGVVFYFELEMAKKQAATK